MKKYSLLLAFALFMNTTYSQHFKAYLISGISFSQIDGDKLSGYNKTGLIAGGATSFKLYENWAFQQEIVYYQRGSRATNEQLSLDNFSVKRLDYIDMIAQAQYAINSRWSALTGFGYGIFIRVKSDVAEDKSLYRNDLFITAGGQYQLTDRLFIALKGQYSMASVFETQNAWNNSIGLSLRYQMF